MQANLIATLYGNKRSMRKVTFILFTGGESHEV